MSAREGIILVDKPPHVTSHDVVDFVRKKLCVKKAGHAGTLDPMATGLLIVLVGQYTKKSAQFSSYDKEYEARLCLGISTDTLDKEGNITGKRDVGLYKENIGNMEKIFRLFTGEIEQLPPMYSAKKLKGKKLYEFARKGIILERKPRKVSVKSIEILDASLPYVSFYVKCSKGTYIRQLAHDIGEKLGCGAHLDSLRRTRIGPYRIEDAIPLDQLKYENILQFA